MRKSKLSLFIKALLAVMLVLSILTLTACVSLGTGGTSGGDDEGTGENGGGEGKPDGGDNEGGSEGDENKPGSGDNTGDGDENKPGSGDNTGDGDEDKPGSGDNTGDGDEDKPGSGDNTGDGDEDKPGSGEGGEGGDDAYETSLCIGVKGSVEALYSNYATLYHGTRAPILAAFDGPRTEPVRLWIYTDAGALTLYSDVIEYREGYWVHEFNYINHDYFTAGTEYNCKIDYYLGAEDYHSVDFTLSVLPVGTEQAEFFGVRGENDVYYSGNATVVAGSDKPFEVAFTSAVINPTVYLNINNITIYDTHAGFFLSDGLYVYEFEGFTSNLEAGETYTAEIKYTDQRGELISEEFTVTVAHDSIGGGDEGGGDNKPEGGEGEGGTEGGENGAYFYGAMTDTMVGPDRSLWVDLYKEFEIYLCFSGAVQISSVTLGDYKLALGNESYNEYGGYSVAVMLPAFDSYYCDFLTVEFISGGETYAESVQITFGSDMGGNEGNVIFIGITDGVADAGPRIDVMLGEQISFYLVFEGVVRGLCVDTNGQSVELGEGYLSDGRYYVPATMSPLESMEMVVCTVTWDNMESAAWSQFEICPIGEAVMPPELVRIETTQSSDSYYESVDVTLSNETVYVTFYLMHEPRDVSANILDNYGFTLCSATVHSADYNSEGYYAVTVGIDFAAMNLFVGEYWISLEGTFGKYESYPYYITAQLTVSAPEAPKFLGVATDAVSDPTFSFTFSSGESFELWLVFDAPVEVMNVRLGDFYVGGASATYNGSDYRASIYVGADFFVYGTEGVVEYMLYGMGYSDTFSFEQKLPELVKIVNGVTYEDYTEVDYETGYQAEFMAGETVELIFVYSHRASEAYFCMMGFDEQVMGTPGEYDEKLGGYPVYYSLTFTRVGVDKFPVVMYDESYSTNPGCEDVHIAFIANILPGELKAHGINTDGYTTDNHTVSFMSGDSVQIYVMLSGYVEGMTVELQLYAFGDYYMNLDTPEIWYVSELGMYAARTFYYADIPGYGFDPSSGETFSYKLDVIVDGNPVGVYVVNVTSSF